MGMLLVSSCPAGHISNFFTQRVGGNAALSVSISTLSTLDIRPLDTANRLPGVVYATSDIRDLGLEVLLLEHGITTVVHLTLRHTRQAP